MIGQRFDLTGKNALVTGAYRGLGFAIAQGGGAVSGEARRARAIANQR